MRMNIEQVPKPSDVDADPVETWGRPPPGSTRAKVTLLGSTGALMMACRQEEFCSNTGDPARCGARRAKQPEAREGRTGLDGKSERPILPKKPGNADGGKGPWFKGNAGRSKGVEIGVSLSTPESVWQPQAALRIRAKNESLVCESMNTLERKPDAGKPHVRFDERGVETERMAGYSGTGNRKGRTQLRPAFTPPRPSSTPQNANFQLYRYCTRMAVSIDGKDANASNSLSNGSER